MSDKQLILVVDDEALVRDAVVDMLSANGWETISAPDGETGVRIEDLVAVVDGGDPAAQPVGELDHRRTDVAATDDDELAVEEPLELGEDGQGPVHATGAELLHHRGDVSRGLITALVRNHVERRDQSGDVVAQRQVDIAEQPADAVGAGGMAWLVAGGLSYTIGAAFYAIKRIAFGHVPDLLTMRPFPGADGLG